MEEQTIKLRGIESKDVDFMLRLVNDPETTHYIQGLITDRGMLLDWIESLTEQEHEYLVELSDGTPIGECSIAVSNCIGEIGYMLLPEYWRKGYGTTVVYCLLAIATNMGLNMVSATTDSNNTASVKLLEKTGFQIHRQGWMLHISEDGNDKSSGQNIVEYRRSL